MSTTVNLGSVKPVSEQDAQKVVTYNTLADDYDSSIAGMLLLSVAGGANVTLTRTQALSKVFKFTGALTANISVLLPATGGAARHFVAWNATSGAFTLTVKTTAGGSTGIIVTQGLIRQLFQDGTNVLDATTETGIPAGQSRVTTQFDKASSTVLSDITGLTANVAAGRPYRFEAVLYTTSNAAAGVQFAIGGTATATSIIYEAIVDNAGAISAQTRATALGTAVGAVTAVTAAYVRITGTIVVNAAGTLTCQFAQNVSNAAASSVLVNSVLEVREMP